MVVNCVSMHVLGRSDLSWVVCGLFLGCLGCFGPPWDVLFVLGCLVSRSDELRLFLQFQVVMNFLGC